jgi:heat shock protein HtpX
MFNRFKTTLLLGSLTGLVILIGYFMGGQRGMVLAFIFATALNFFSYWFSDKIVLAMYQAKEASEREAPELYTVVANLTQKAQMPMPRIYIIPEESPNAFATGRNPEHAVVAVTEGLLRLMNREELEGVLAHELAHVKNRDILISSIAATIAGAIMILANMVKWAALFGGGSRDDEDRGGLGMVGMLVMAILAPIAAMLIQMAISRSREYLADETGAHFTGQPRGLANALYKLGIYSHKIPMSANPQTAHMFIVNPLTGRSLMNLFSTHPPIEERIARLRGQKVADPLNAAVDQNQGHRMAEESWRRLSG